jgi:hypothetical protein
MSRTQQALPAVLLLAAHGMGDNKKQKIVPAWGLKNSEKGTQSVVEFAPLSEICRLFCPASSYTLHRKGNLPAAVPIPPLSYRFIPEFFLNFLKPV